MRWIVVALVAACGFPKPPDVVGEPSCCQLVASRPALAKAGATLTLEGVFDPAATITFPGGEAAPLTMLGRYRATVVVPASATAGDLTMMSGGAAVGTAPFRRVTFSPSLARFAIKDPQASGARQDVSLAELRSGATATTVGRYLYVVGGGSGGIASRTVERAALQPDGTLGPFAIVPDVTLMTARSQHQAVAIGGFLYIIGGFDGTSSLASIERAPIADGTLGPFEPVEVALSTSRAEMTSEIIGAWLYVVGGTDASQPLGTIERAPLLPDGSLGAFEVVPGVTLMTARKGHTSLVTADALYVLAGSNGQAIDTIERLPIAANGDLGASEAASIPNTLAARDGATGVGLVDAYCLIGGTNRRDVECATIAPDGKLGPFITPTATLSSSRVGQMAALVANNLFILGGDVMTPSIERGSINSGAIGALTTAIPLTTAQPGPGAQSTVVVGDNVYVMGLDSLERARVPLDGSLGTFGPATANPIVSTFAHSTVVLGNYLYVIGGSAATGNVARVERAPINPDGTLAPFATVAGVVLTKPRQGHTSVVIGNNLYVIGGISGTTTQQFEGSVERATINVDGSISTFAIVAGINFTPRTGHASVVIGNSIYMIGGRTGSSTVTGVVERAILNSDGSINGVVGAASLSTARAYPALAVTGGYLYVFGGQGAGTLDTIERAPIDTTIGVLAPIAGTLTIGRSGANTVVLGNDLYVLGGTTGRTVELAELQ